MTKYAAIIRGSKDDTYGGYETYEYIKYFKDEEELKSFLLFGSNSYEKIISYEEISVTRSIDLKIKA